MLKQFLMNHRRRIATLFLILGFLIGGLFIFKNYPRNVRIKLSCITINCNDVERLNVSFYHKGEFIKEVALKNRNRVDNKIIFSTRLIPQKYLLKIRIYKKDGIYLFEKKIYVKSSNNKISVEI